MVLVVAGECCLDGLKIAFAAGVTAFVLGILQAKVTDAGDDREDGDDDKKFNECKSRLFLVTCRHTYGLVTEYCFLLAQTVSATSLTLPPAGSLAFSRQKLRVKPVQAPAAQESGVG